MLGHIVGWTAAILNAQATFATWHLVVLLVVMCLKQSAPGDPLHVEPPATCLLVGAAMPHLRDTWRLLAACCGGGLCDCAAAGGASQLKRFQGV